MSKVQFEDLQVNAPARPDEVETSEHPEDSGTETLYRIKWWHGPAATFGLGVFTELLRAFGLPSGDAMVLLVLGILLAAFSGRVSSILISSAIALSYSLWYHDPSLSELTPTLRIRLIIDVLATAGAIAMAYSLRRWLVSASAAGRRSRKLSQRVAVLESSRKRLSEALQETKEIVDASPLGLVWFDLQGNILRASPLFAEMLDNTAEELAGRNISEFQVGSYSIKERLNWVARNDGRNEFEATLERPDGLQCHVLVSCIAQPDKQIEKKILCYVRDITAEKLSEAERAHTEDFLQGVVAALPAAVYTTDAQGLITMYNLAAEELWGRRPEVGVEEWCGSMKIYSTAGAELPLDRCPMALTLKGGRAVSGEEVIIERPDGVRRVVRPYPQPLRNRSGELVGAVNMLVDVTDQRAAEDARRVAEHEAHALTRRIAAQFRISELLANSEDVLQDLPEVLKVLCEMTSAQVCALWLQRENGALGSVANVSVDDSRFAEFLEVNRTIVLKPGSGLPGRVFESNEPAWIYELSSDSNSPRGPYARRCGLQSHFAVPLQGRQSVHGAVDFLFTDKRHRDDALIELVSDTLRQVTVALERRYDREALVASERRNSAFFEQAGVGVAHADINGNLSKVNKRFAELLGYQEDDLKRLQLRNLVHPQDTARYVYDLGMLWAGESQHLNLELHFIRVDGSSLPVNLSMSVVRSDSGEAQYIVAVIQDISARVAAETALRESEQRIRAMLEYAPLILVEIESDGTIETIIGSGLNEARSDRNPQANVGKTIYELNAEQPDRIALFERALKGETVETMLVENDVAFKAFLAPKHGINGETTGVIAVLSSVTDLYRTQKTLSDREAFLESVLDNAPLILTQIGPDGVINMSMGSSRTSLGINPRELTGKSIFQLYGQHPNAIELFKRALDGESYQVDFELGDITYQVAAGPYRDPDGQIAGVLAVSADISAHKKTERALRESEERFRNVADSAPVMIWVSGTENEAVWLNRPWLEFTGRRLEDELGYQWLDSVHPDDLERCQEICGGNFERRQPFNMTFRMRRHDGEYRLLLDHGVPRFSDDGQFLGYIGSCIDITNQQLELEESALSAQSVGST